VGWERGGERQRIHRQPDPVSAARTANRIIEHARKTDSLDERRAAPAQAGRGIGAAFASAAAGSTITNLDPWYRNLRQPDWAPPGAVSPGTESVGLMLLFAPVALAVLEHWSWSAAADAALWRSAMTSKAGQAT
jgi:hypothetical protein